jgi:hypothetical protein
MAPPGGEYQKVSALVPLPDYLPGLGTLYVNPKTLPVGPFLAYDKEGHLVSSIYMVPIKDIDTHKKFRSAPGSVTRPVFMRPAEDGGSRWPAEP